MYKVLYLTESAHGKACVVWIHEERAISHTSLTDMSKIHPQRCGGAGYIDEGLNKKKNDW